MSLRRANRHLILTIARQRPVGSQNLRANTLLCDYALANEVPDALALSVNLGVLSRSQPARRRSQPRIRTRRTDCRMYSLPDLQAQTYSLFCIQISHEEYTNATKSRTPPAGVGDAGRTGCGGMDKILSEERE
jgi:hypothetical protein